MKGMPPRANLDGSITPISGNGVEPEEVQARVLAEELNCSVKELFDALGKPGAWNSKLTPAEVAKVRSSIGASQLPPPAPAGGAPTPAGPSPAGAATPMSTPTAATPPDPIQPPEGQFGAHLLVGMSSRSNRDPSNPAPGPEPERSDGPLMTDEEKGIMSAHTVALRELTQELRLQRMQSPGAAPLPGLVDPQKVRFAQALADADPKLDNATKAAFIKQALQGRHPGITDAEIMDVLRGVQ